MYEKKTKKKSKTRRNQENLILLFYKYLYNIV